MKPKESDAVRNASRVPAGILRVMISGSSNAGVMSPMAFSTSIVPVFFAPPGNISPWACVRDRFRPPSLNGHLPARLSPLAKAIVASLPSRGYTQFTCPNDAPESSPNRGSPSKKILLSCFRKDAPLVMIRSRCDILSGFSPPWWRAVQFRGNRIPRLLVIDRAGFIGEACPESGSGR